MRKEKPRSGIVELEGGHAQVQHHAVQRGNAGLAEQGEHVAEIALDQVQAAGMAGGQRGAAGDGVGIAVDRPQRAVGRVQDGRGIAAAAESAVQVGAAIVRGERLQHFRQHDGDVPGAHAGASAAAGRGAGA